MSGNAALAAAKRRRNPAMAQNNEQTMQQVQKPVRKAQNIQELVLEHDRRIFMMEKEITQQKSNQSNTDTGEGLAVANSAENMAKTNSAEIKLLKSTVAKQAKALSDAQTLLTTLRATLNTQTAELNSYKSLKDDIAALKIAAVNNHDNKNEESEESEDNKENEENEENEDNEDSDTNVELTVNEK